MKKSNNGNTSGLNRNRKDMQECWITLIVSIHFTLALFDMNPQHWCYCNIVSPVSPHT